MHVAAARCGGVRHLTWYTNHRCGLGFEAVVVYDAASSLNWADAAHWLRTTPLVRPATLPIAISIAVFCNEGVVIMALNVQRTMAEPARFPRVMVISLALFSALYLLLGVCGFALYGMGGDTLPSPISDAFSNSPIHIAAVALYALQVSANWLAHAMIARVCSPMYQASTGRLTTCPSLPELLALTCRVRRAVQLVPTFSIVLWLSYSALEAYYLRLVGVAAGSAKHRIIKWRLFVPVRVGAILLSALIALIIKDFGDFLALIGAVANALGIYLLPHLCWIRIFGSRLRAPDRSVAFVLKFSLSVVVIAFGATLAVYGSYTSLKSMINHNSSAS